MFLDSYTVSALQSNLLQDCWAFLPELILAGTIILMLLVRLLGARWHLGWEALILTLAALGVSVMQWQTGAPARDAFGGGLFGNEYAGLLRYDNFTIFIRIFLYAFTALTIWLTMLTGIPDQEDSADFYCLLLGAALGMSLMASANHLLMVFIAVEMASLPSFGLAGFLKGKRASSEAALKYVVYGGGAAGIMLYGISLIAGRFGTGYLPDLGLAIPLALKNGVDSVMLLGLLFIFIGLAFKLSAVPFHFWCPDVFEGAAAEVAAYLSVASKGAALALTGRLLLTIVGTPTSLTTLAPYLIPTLAFFGALTATFGNLAAYPQTNLKRLLAYSTIDHAGYMMMGLATLSRDGAEAVLFYLIAYLAMNLGAFAVVAFIRNLTGSEELASYRGLIYRSPALAITMSVFLLSLLGMPPLVGFAAKFQIFRVLYDAAQLHAANAAQWQVVANTPGVVEGLAISASETAAEQTRLSYVLFTLLVIGGVNTVISLVYYIKVLKVMILERTVEEVEGQPTPQLPLKAGSAFLVTFLAALVLVGGILWNPLSVQSKQGVKEFPQVQLIAPDPVKVTAGAGQ